MPTTAPLSPATRRNQTMVTVTPDELRARIAALVANHDQPTERLGEIALQPHQRAAVGRIAAAMREFGGALLADETGLGKTFVALSVARDAHRPLVVAPAALGDMWHQAAQSAGVTIEFTSVEALSRRRGERAGEHDLVVVDESHHFRNPATARYRALADLTACARVLLLSATPVHNSASDLTTLLALFLGARASTLDSAWTSRCIVRRSPNDVPTAHLPHVPPPEPLCVRHDERHLDAILALPPPVPAMDGGDGGALLVYSLLRQWASTRAALVEALRRRLARATALMAGLETGHHPSTAELAAWAFADGTVQLAFPELVIDGAHQAPDATGLAACVRAHTDAVRALLDDLAHSPDPDVERATHLIELRARHRGEKLVVFSQYADSVSAMFRLLRSQPGVAALTADSGRVAGGALTRREVLRRFAPRAHNVAAAPRAERIDLLLTTDLLSEGVNLQDASVLVHLDLPWTPARLDQRVGRVARLGSAHERVAVYAMLPPAGAERIVRVEQRLREKLGAATRAVGVAGTIIPSLTLGKLCAAGCTDQDSPDSTARGPATLTEAIQRVLADWAGRGSVGGRPEHPDLVTQPPGPTAWTVHDSSQSNADIAVSPTSHTPIVAAVDSPTVGFIAVLGDAARPRLIADVGMGPADDPETLLAALRSADGAGVQVDDETVAAAIEAVAQWRSRHCLRRDLTVDGALRARARRSVADRIAAITRRAPRHRRPAIAALAATARRTVTARYGAGAERILGELAQAPMPDEAWLRAVSTFGSLHGAGDDLEQSSLPLLALLILSSSADPIDKRPGARGGP